MYTALVLHPDEQARLMRDFFSYFVDGWKVHAHHMTINMGGADKGPAAHLVGQEGEITVTHAAEGALVVALKVESDIPSKNEIKHVTLCVNEAQGGKAKMSNDLTEWDEVPKGCKYKGTVQVCE